MTHFWSQPQADIEGSAVLGSSVLIFQHHILKPQHTFLLPHNWPVRVSFGKLQNESETDPTNTGKGNGEDFPKLSGNKQFEWNILNL